MAVLNSSRVNGYQNRLTAEFLLFVVNLAIGVSRMVHSLVQPREEQNAYFQQLMDQLSGKTDKQQKTSINAIHREFSKINQKRLQALMYTYLHVRIQPQSPCVRKDIAKNRFPIFGQMARSEGPFALRAVLNPRGVIVNLLAGGADRMTQESGVQVS